MYKKMFIVKWIKTLEYVLTLIFIAEDAIDLKVYAQSVHAIFEIGVFYIFKITLISIFQIETLPFDTILGVPCFKEVRKRYSLYTLINLYKVIQENSLRVIQG